MSSGEQATLNDLLDVLCEMTTDATLLKVGEEPLPTGRPMLVVGTPAKIRSEGVLLVEIDSPERVVLGRPEKLAVELLLCTWIGTQPSNSIAIIPKSESGSSAKHASNAAIVDSGAFVSVRFSWWIAADGSVLELCDPLRLSSSPKAVCGPPGSCPEFVLCQHRHIAASARRDLCPQEPSESWKPPNTCS